MIEKYKIEISYKTIHTWYKESKKNEKYKFYKNLKREKQSSLFQPVLWFYHHLNERHLGYSAISQSAYVVRYIHAHTHTPKRKKKKKKMIKTENILDFLSINYHNWPKKGNGIQFENTKNNIKDTKNNE